MVDTTAKYVYEVYRQRSVSLAAKALFISQPALSAAIKKAEKELGAPIFDRRTLPFALTKEGKAYIGAIERIIQIQEQTAEEIRQLQQIQGGVLKIAASTHVSFYVIPRVLEVFHKKYPHIEVNITLTGSDGLYDLLEKGAVDLVFMRLGKISPRYTAVELFKEKLVVAMRRDYPGSEQLVDYAITYEQLITGEHSVKTSDMTLFHGIEFIYTPPNTNLYKKTKHLFGKQELPTFVTVNSGRQQMNYNLMEAGFGALLTTDTNVATMPPNDNCMYFILDGDEVERSFSIIHPQEQLSDIAGEFIDTAQSVFACENPFKRLIRK